MKTNSLVKKLLAVPILAGALFAAHPQKAEADGLYGGLQIEYFMPSDPAVQQIMGNVIVGGLEAGYETQGGFKFGAEINYYSKQETPITYGNVSNPTGQISDLSLQLRVAKAFDLGGGTSFYLGPEVSYDSFNETGSFNGEDVSYSDSTFGYGGFVGLESSISSNLSVYGEYLLNSIPIANVAEANGGAGKNMGGSTITGGLRYRF